MPQGGRNSGRVVATMNNGASAPRSAMPRSTSSVVGSAQCRSSNASTTGCTFAPAITQFVSAANCRRRSSSGAKVGRAFLRQRNVEERRQQGDVLRRIEL